MVITFLIQFLTILINFFDDSIKQFRQTFRYNLWDKTFKTSNVKIILLPANTRAIKPTFNAFNEMSVRSVKTTGRITADLNLRANKIGSMSFFSFPRASAKKLKKRRKLIWVLKKVLTIHFTIFRLIIA